MIWDATHAVYPIYKIQVNSKVDIEVYIEWNMIFKSNIEVKYPISKVHISDIQSPNPCPGAILG